MPQETLGYVELEWVCSHCGARNPGPQKTCAGCGAAQGQDVQFQQAAEDRPVTEPQALARAQAAPDIHCGYCGARNPAAAQTCSQCGASLKEGTQRTAGRVVGAHRTEPAPAIRCPFCGESNSATAQKCARCGGVLSQPQAEPQPTARPRGCNPLPFVLAAIALLIALIYLLTRTTGTIATVNAVNWTRSIAVLELRPVSYEGWRADLPAGATLGACTQRVARIQDSPAPNARKVCGTAYVVDRGTGYGEVVQDCRYEILADWCRYTVNEWRAVDVRRITGNDLSPAWPMLNLTAGQREGDREELYEIRFVADDKVYTYSTRDATEFARYRPGSRWQLEINSFGTIVGIAPAP